MNALSGKAVDVTIVGGGMITNDLILPSIYHLQRMGVVNAINVCALNSEPLKVLKDNAELKQAFPNNDFTPYPGLQTSPQEKFPDLYKDVIAGMDKYNAVVIAVPDHMHYPILKEALANDQHVLCVKPLVLNYRESVEIEKLARDKGLFIGVEYHKRFDRRSLLAKRHYEQGELGEFMMGEAKMIEPYFYRFSNFQDWFTVENADPFTYVGCHYVDLVWFITGLKPVGVSVSGVKGKFPNGNEGYMWANGRVVFENGAILSVTDGLGYPDEGAGSNEQCLTMFCEGDGKSGMIKHNDQFRGVTHSYLEGIGCAGSSFNFINPDFFRLVPWEGEGYRPIGYGFDSIAATINTISRMELGLDQLKSDEALMKRREVIEEADQKGIIATPANSFVNELVTEAARMSIAREGDFVNIVYGSSPHVELRG